MPEATATQAWTCARCEMTASWMPGVERPERPANWAEEDGLLYCLSCRRELAGDAGVAHMDDDASLEERRKLRHAARVEFEITRDPTRPDNRIAKACGTSTPAVRKARQRLGVPPAAQFELN